MRRRNLGDEPSDGEQAADAGLTAWPDYTRAALGTKPGIGSSCRARQTLPGPGIVA